MRRRDREVMDAATIDEIIAQCDCVHLGFAAGEEAYVVPVNFAAATEGGRRVLYFHGAQEGRRADLIRRCGSCAFTMDCAHALIRSESACGFSYAYRSVMGKGTVAFLEREEEKAAALAQILRRYDGEGEYSLSPEVLRRTAVARLEITELTAKEHLPL